jgi:hypothetical protein
LTETDSVRKDQRSPSNVAGKLKTDFDVIKEDDEYLKTIKKNSKEALGKVVKINIIPNKKAETTKLKAESLTERYQYIIIKI